MFYQNKFIWVLSIALLTLSACGSENDTSPNPDDPTQNNSNTPEPFESLCATTPDISDFGPNLVQPGQQFTLTLTSAAPAPWDVGNNTWTIEIEDGSGTLIDDATIEITPYMPDHGHGVSPPNYIGRSQGSGGLYDIDTFNLIMPGFWELTAEVSAPGIEAEVIPFRICVEG